MKGDKKHAFKFSPPEGRGFKWQVTVHAPSGSIVFSDLMDPREARAREKLSQRIASRLRRTPEDVLQMVEAAWNNACEEWRRQQKEAKEAAAKVLQEAGYLVKEGRLYRERSTPAGAVELAPLCNFTAQIVEAVVRDDGAEQAAYFTVAGAREGGRPLPPIQVPAAEFGGLAWVTTAWHGEAVVYAGQGTRDHLRAAIELLSPDRRRRTVYAHLGWRRVGESWAYLHAGGAIGLGGTDGTVGTVAEIEVDPPEPLARFVLPSPPSGDYLVNAVQASLDLLETLAPDRLTFPLLAAVYRAALGDLPGVLDFAVHAAGPHGVGKSELSALMQQHYGAGLDARHLPAAWASTANALEALAFAAKDALLVVDDYAPRGAIADRQRLDRDADRLLRAQGNRAGRQRMRADGSLRPAKPPRGLILSTGEDVPPGQSLRGRLQVLEVSPGDVKFPHLAAHQHNAASGLFAQAMAGFVGWLAPQYEELRSRLPLERARLREQALSNKGSSRTPGIVADLALGLKLLLDFAHWAGAITDVQRNELACRGWQALREAADTQAEHVQAAEPTAHFLRLLAGALGTTAFVAGPNGREPNENPKGWGWYERTYGVGENERTDWYPCNQGKRVGWVDGDDLYLEPAAVFAAVQDLAHRSGDGLAVTQATLGKRLKEKGLLASWDEPRKRVTVRRTLEGRRVEVWHLRISTLSPAEKPSQPSQPSHDAEGDFATFGGNGACAEQSEPSPWDGEPAWDGRPSQSEETTVPNGTVNGATVPPANGSSAEGCGELGRLGRSNGTGGGIHGSIFVKKAPKQKPRQPGEDDPDESQ